MRLSLGTFFKIFFLVGCVSLSHSQSKEYTSLQGTIIDEDGNPIEGATIYVANKGTISNDKGRFLIPSVLTGNYKVTVSFIGFEDIEEQVSISSKNKTDLNFTLKSSLNDLASVELIAKSRATFIKESGFNVESVEIAKLKTQSLEINKILNNSAGIRVRTSGGVGSDFIYRINGHSGDAIKFFIDEIPMDYYGESYSINNIPIGLIDRVDIFKGVVPIALGTDALGGAINLVTNQGMDDFLEGSATMGSFNTFKSALHGQFRFDSGFTTKFAAFYTYSDNNYKVWGQGVNYADESTGYKAVEFTEENPAERFNDDFQTYTGKVDIGYTNKKWADQFFIGLLASDLKKGVQTGQTMGSVYGRVRNNKKTLMPNMVYKKKNFIKEGLEVNAFAGYSYNEGVLIDTSLVQYDWRNKVVGVPREEGGETNFYGKSLYTQKDYSQVYRLNTSYELPLDFKIGFNYLYEYNKSKGSEEFPNERLERAAYAIPQSLGKHFGGLALETKQFDDKLDANLFVKYYGYDTSLNELVYTTEYVVNTITNKIGNWGGGFAGSYKISQSFLIKSSLEKAYKMPTPTQAIGDGVTILNSPYIKPEQSFNINYGIALGRYAIGDHGIRIAINSYYNDTKDKIGFVVNSAAGTGFFTNIGRVTGQGVDVDITYDYNRNFKFNLNGTYTNLRNNDEFDELGNNNIIYRDRLRNEPYFTANAGLQYNVDGVFQKKSKLFTYLSSSYVHEFFLDWPSLGTAALKSTIPTQLVFDAGFGYRFPSEKLTLAFDASNILNEQVYDNFLLQKPGRAFFLKATYQFIKE